MPTGIPTDYSGISFRSRLEAAWARFFDGLGWPWQYEAIDLAGYIPDFLLSFPWQDLLVEIKPATKLSDFAQYTSKIEHSGWRHDAIILGTALLDFEDRSFPPIGLLSQRDHFAEGEPRGGWCWDKGMLFRCAECREISLVHESGAWNCYRCGIYRGNAHLVPLLDLDIAGLWLECREATAWRPARAGRT